jgi:hypothetical protein
MNTHRDAYDFDVALSFAGEDREYVEDVNQALKAVGVRTFLDSDYFADTWGEDLVEYFDNVYRKRARYALLFVSRHYAEKMWPRHERRSALARALEERSAYVLPVRLDATAIEGLRPTVGYLDARRIGIDGLVRAVTAKLAGRSGWPDGWPGDRAPRTRREIDEVLYKRPGGWEYLYFAGVLNAAMEALQSKYLDHELRYAPPSGERVEFHEIESSLRHAVDDLLGLIRSLAAMMTADIQERAFGARGATGDAERIERLAQRWTSVYAGLLDWSARLRGAGRSAQFDRVFELLARLVDRPIEDYRAFVRELVAHADRIPTAVATGEPLSIILTLNVGVDDALLNEFNSELERLTEELGGA